MCDAVSVRAFGTGAEFWRVRAVVLAAGATQHDMSALVDRLRGRLGEQPEDSDGWRVGGEFGTGETGEETIGASFWVAADDVGSAAATAVETLTIECEALTGRSHLLYEVLVVPHTATVSPGELTARNSQSTRRLSREDS